ncbi:MAG TPA: caspase family protein [Geminicoccus sp.]|uniref:caspase family protein n=1 Tax=Geminicoccus sp. TaxID=2024832 RepID=UPI002E3500DF|nr:caspase family protein [Geminicoccus sp.]HEX2525774.1 caspase family protein [Geminicoccus sp.]
MVRGVVAAVGMVLLSSTAVLANPDAKLCVTAISAPPAALDEIIEACTRVLPIAATARDKQLFHRYRGWALEGKGALPAALADYNQALAINPGDQWSLQGRAQVHKAMGQLDLARSDYLRLDEISPDTRWRVALEDLGTLVAPRPPKPVVAEPAVVPAVEPAIEVATRSTLPAAIDGLPPGTGAAAEPVDPEALVRQIQVGLRELGYYAGPINGRVGTQTRQAMEAFADGEGMEPWDEPDEQMFAAVQEVVRERQAQAAEERRALIQRAQQSLADLGYDIGYVDGIWGARSRQALTSWLASQGQPAREQVDGEIVAWLEKVVASRQTEQATSQAPLDVVQTPVAAPPEPLVAEAPAADVAAPAAPTPAVPTTQAVPAATTVVVSLSEEPAVAKPDEQAPPAIEPEAEANAADPSPAIYDEMFEQAAAGTSDLRRVALVIGNADYEHANPLVNPERDAEGIADALEEIGFDKVIRGINLDGTGMDERTEEFAEEAESADLALVYYAGHGFQHGGKNYIVPIDAEVKTERTLRRLPRLDELIEDASHAEKIAMVFIDACRDNPFGRLARSLGPSRSSGIGTSETGWASPSEVPPQTLISFATKAGTVAYDGDGTNSPYAMALMRYLKTPGLEVVDLVRKVHDEVKQETDGKQQPDFQGSLDGEKIYLMPVELEVAGIELVALTPSELKAVQRSLNLMGWWQGPIDGQPSEWLLDTVSGYQRSLGQPATGRLSPSDMVALHRQAMLRQPPEPLPEMGSMASFMRRLRQSEPEALRLAGMIADPAFRSLPEWPKDTKEAAINYRDAAERGDVIAMARLGILLTRPSEPPENQAVGRSWLERAASQGDPLASLRLAELLMTGPASVSEVGRVRARELLKVAAASPDTDGLALTHLRELEETEVQ